MSFSRLNSPLCLCFRISLSSNLCNNWPLGAEWSKVVLLLSKLWPVSTGWVANADLLGVRVFLRSFTRSFTSLPVWPLTMQKHVRYKMYHFPSQYTPVLLQKILQMNVCRNCSFLNMITTCISSNWWLWWFTVCNIEFASKGNSDSERSKPHMLCFET